jgi:ABC-type transport system involved in cytochrome bd biosynthesis fused ATPase/permease subunit
MYVWTGIRGGFIYMDRCVYNALSKFAGRVKRNMGTIYITVGMTCVMLAFSLLVWSTSFALMHVRLGLFWAGVAIFVIGLLAWWQALRVTQKEEAQRNEDRKQLTEAIKDLRNTMAEIRRDKELKSDTSSKVDPRR